MAKQIVETLIDDLDGGPATETVTFGLDGGQYEIDLNEQNATVLRQSLVKYLAAGRRLRAGARNVTPVAPRTTATTRDYDIVQLREWAGRKKIAVPARGRIPASVVEQYKAEGGS